MAAQLLMRVRWEMRLAAQPLFGGARAERVHAHEQIARRLPYITIARAQCVRTQRQHLRSRQHSRPAVPSRASLAAARAATKQQAVDEV